MRYSGLAMIRYGLCCIFKKEPIRFRRTTARYIAKYRRSRQLAMLAELCHDNAAALMKALQFCLKNGIKAFRVNSQILPLKTHPEAGYAIEDLPGHDKIVGVFKACGRFCKKNDIRTTFHPDQFILLSSADENITRRSIGELRYQAQVAGWIRADVINIHGGGAYGDKRQALQRVAKQVEKLPASIRKRLTFENDDRVYTPSDLLPLCKQLEIPLVYDVHHHRCLKDGLSVEAATEAALKTWKREPLFHLSSPLNGWRGNQVHKHHDYIDPQDFPPCWQHLDVTVEVEAKAKEQAVLKLIEAMNP